MASNELSHAVLEDVRKQVVGEMSARVRSDRAMAMLLDEERAEQKKKTAEDEKKMRESAKRAAKKEKEKEKRKKGKQKPEEAHGEGKDGRVDGKSAVAAAEAGATDGPVSAADGDGTRDEAAGGGRRGGGGGEEEAAAAREVAMAPRDTTAVVPAVEERAAAERQQDAHFAAAAGIETDEWLPGERPAGVAQSLVGGADTDGGDALGDPDAVGLPPGTPLAGQLVFQKRLGDAPGPWSEVQDADGDAVAGSGAGTGSLGQQKRMEIARRKRECLAFDILLVGAWVQELVGHEGRQRFSESEIDLEAVLELTPDEMLSLGGNSGARGWRRRLRARARDEVARRAATAGGPGWTGAGGSVEEGEGSMHTDCVVCMTQMRCRMLRPCGHVCVCAACASDLHDCPICRRVVESTLPAFL